MSFTKYLCHRRPYRSFFIKNHQFPVCARCTGIYNGIILYFIISQIFKINFSFPIVLYGIILCIPTAIDGYTQRLCPRESNNYLRFFTGILGGIGLGILLL